MCEGFEIDDEGLVDYLSRRFPERRRDILARANELDRELYSVVSELFWWEIFEPALRQSDADQVAASFEVVEDLLTRGSPRIKDAVRIRVTPYLIELAGQHDALIGPSLRVDLPRAMGR